MKTESLFNIFAILCNVWLNRRQLDSPIHFCRQSCVICFSGCSISRKIQPHTDKYLRKGWARRPLWVCLSVCLSVSIYTSLFSPMISQYHRPGALTEIYLSKFWRLEVKDQGTSRFRVWGGPFSWFTNSHTRERDRNRERAHLSQLFSYQSANLIYGDSTSHPNHFLIVSPP